MAWTLACLLLAFASLSFRLISAEEFKCPEQFGYYRDLNDCSKYYLCVFGDSHHEKCTGGLHFSLELQTCDWPRNVNCVKEEAPEQKPPIYLEDEVFSSSRRNSATASQISLLKPQPVEIDPASNFHPSEGSKGFESLSETNPRQSRNQQQPKEAATTPEPTTSAPYTNNPASIGEKSDSKLVDPSEDDPLYTGDETEKIALDNYDPQEPKFDEAAPPLVDSEGGIHIADGGHGLDAFAGLAHLPGLGDFRVLEKPIFNSNIGKDENDKDYQKRNRDSTSSTIPRKLEGYPNNNGDLKDPDIIIDYSNGNGKEIGFDYEDRKSPYPTPPPTIFDDNADHRDFGGFDVITPIRNKNAEPTAEDIRKEKDDSDLSLIEPLPISDLPRIRMNQKDVDQIKPAIAEFDSNLKNFQNFNFDRDHSSQPNESLPAVQFDDHPSGVQNLQFIPENVQYSDEPNASKNFDPHAIQNVKVDSATFSEDDVVVNDSRNKNPGSPYPQLNAKKSVEYEHFDSPRLHQHGRNVRPKEQENRPTPYPSDNFDSYPTSAKDLFLENQQSFKNHNQEEGLKSTLPVQPKEDDFGAYMGNQRQAKKIDPLPIDQSRQSVTDTQKERPILQRPNPPNRQSEKNADAPPNKPFYPANFDDVSSIFNEYDSAKRQFTGDYFPKDILEVVTTPSVRTRPTRPRKSTTTTTPTTTTPAPIKIRTRVPIAQVPKPTRPAVVAPALGNLPSRPPNEYPTPEPYSLAQKCDPRKCRLPDCRCGGSDIPGGLKVGEIPQLVLLTFDDAVNDLNNDLYEELFYTGRSNPNGCPILGTFYVSHEWTDYGQVQTLYSKGHEIASHSITHSYGEKFSKNQWMREINGQREILHLYGGVKMEDIRGMRAPFLQIGGNKMFDMLFDANFTYDSSMPVYENNPPFWPYTLDYAQSHECMIFPCPTKSFPGLWEVGMVMWVDLRGGRCSMGDACSNPPDEEAVTKMLMKNFNRHYKSNRSPFGLFYHSAWFNTQHHRRGFVKFLDEILKKDDVWLVTNWQLIQWMRRPTPNSELKNFEPFQCRRTERPPACPKPTVCNVWYQGGVRYMKTCQPCPVKYPWVGSTGYESSTRG